MSREREKRRGSYFFWDAWRGSEVSGLTYAAKGLWIDMLAVMADKTPQGVIAGDLEALAEAMGFAGPMAHAWATTYSHLIEELETKRVFSRGEDVDDDLDSDCIVNRRMYREWCKAEGISADRRRAASIRWERAKGLDQSDADRAILEKIDAEIARDACKTHASGCKTDAKRMQRESEERRENKGDSEESGGGGACKNMLIPTQPYPTQPNPNPGGAGGAVQIAEAIGLLEPLNGRSVFGAIIELTGDRRGARAKWWNSVVNAFRKKRLLGALMEQVEFTRRKRSELSQPSRYLVKRVLGCAREHDVLVPDLPGGEA